MSSGLKQLNHVLPGGSSACHLRIVSKTVQVFCFCIFSIFLVCLLAIEEDIKKVLVSAPHAGQPGAQTHVAVSEDRIVISGTDPGSLGSILLPFFISTEPWQRTLTF